MWIFLGWITIVQIAFVIIVTILGENYVVEKGYYKYSPVNNPFIENVPLWIIPLWLHMIQITALLGHVLGLGLVDIIIPPFFQWGGIVVCLFSGVLCFLIDFIIIEPLFSKRLGLWSWHIVDNGFFNFIPKRYNKYTAPAGNYVVWFGFPVIAGYIVVALFALTH